MSLPFRKAQSQDLSMAIRQYISMKYNQHTDMFKEDFEVIDALREQAINVVEPHVNGLKKIMAYGSQLVWIARKIPNDLGVGFTWYPALGYNKEKPITLDNLKFEQASVLYNLAALYSQLAVSSNRNTTEGLKSVCNYFCLSAGVIGHIQEYIIPEMQIDPPEDLDNTTLEYLKILLLAQAQECFWRKAVMDGYRDSSIAKLAIKTSDLYGIAGDLGVKSQSISSEWIHFALAKHYHFLAAAQYRQACDCLDKKKYGEEVSRLRESITYAKEGLREARYLNKLILEDLNGLKVKATEDLKRAEKDNDMIYLCIVPPKTELKPIERVVMAFPRVPLEVSEPLSFLGKNGEFGRSLFEKLVPFAVHVAASIFEQRLDRIVNNSIINPLEALTTQIHSALSFQSLPGSLQALEKPLGLTPTLMSHATEIRQIKAVERLQRSLDDTLSLAHSSASIYTEASSYLISERAENERYKARYGTDRWTRPDSEIAAPKLYEELEKINGYLKSAADSDRSIYEKFKACSGLLRILSSSHSEICNFVPNARRVAMSPKLKDQASKLRTSLNDLNKLESRRRKLIESLKEKVKKDDISHSILIEATRLESLYPAQKITAAHFEDFLEERLSKYDSYIQALQSEEKEQNRQLKQLEICNKEFVKVRIDDGAIEKEREKTLQELEDAYFQYKEIAGYLESGRKFYNDLAQIIEKFRDEAKNWVAKRGEECVRIEREFKTGRLPSSPVVQDEPLESHQTHQTTIANLNQTRSHTSSFKNDALEELQSSKSPPSLVQKLPQKPVIAIWDPSIGINFARKELDASSRTSSISLDNSIDALQENDKNTCRMNANYEKDCYGTSINTNSTSANDSRSNHTWDPQQGLRFG
ncbi:pH-response regulator protein palA/RIM20 [Erysiphe neolycopersici]|uniref:pH-response regulator protein palA/RIM20 n=1 Tax=Erysiphe neolycopersici TaxID=212602 RepID=A0A420HMC5_9PEZI|nr:pH-response regulator protein palA/RIM20 [Erysiphe neolycopersici]